MDIDKIRVGNYLKYEGKLLLYSGKVGRVDKIELLSDRESYLVTIFGNEREEIKQIRAYKEDIKPILLESRHVLNAGFVKDPIISIYRRGNVTIYSMVTEKKGTVGNSLIYESSGHRAVAGVFKVPQNEEEVMKAMKAGEHVGHFHNFQNFMTDHFNEKISPN